jgi:hypothetical protein
VALASAVVALLLGWRPSRRQALVLLALLAASVGAAAWAHDSPFNGVAFALLAAGNLASGLLEPASPLHLAVPWARAAGAMSVAFGAVYPHFLGPAGFAYVHSAPLGVVPCPTLAVLSGIALLAAGMSPPPPAARRRAWPTAVAAWGLFYGAFGAFRLRVGIDALLIASSLALAVVTWCSPCRRAGRGREPSQEPPRQALDARE